jgi:hypothetical protein
MPLPKKMLDVLHFDQFIAKVRKIEAAIKEANLKSNVIPFSPGSSVQCDPP